MSNIEEIKFLLKEGAIIIKDLAPLLQDQLDTKISNYVDKPHGIQLFLKTMFHYGLISSEQLRPFQEDLHLPLIQKLGAVIDVSIQVKKIFPLHDTYLAGTIWSNLSSFDIHICDVANCSFKGASHPHFMGLLFINLGLLKTDADFDLSVVHEIAHQELFLLNLLDRLVLGSISPSLIHSPYQNKVRPTIGRLHSAHALYRMIQYELHLKRFNNVERFRKYLNDTILTFSTEELTAFGYLLIDVYKKVL